MATTLKQPITPGVNVKSVPLSAVRAGAQTDSKGKLTPGTTQTAFNPNQDLQRAQMAYEKTLPIVTADKAITDLGKKKEFLTRNELEIQRQQELNAQNKAKKDATALSEQQRKDDLALRQQEADAKAKLGKDISKLTGQEEITPSPMEDINKRLDDEYTKYQSDIDKLSSGTFPLRASDLAEIEAVKAQFNQLKEEQKLANRNYEAGIKQLGIVSGRSRYAPELETGNIANAVNVGIGRIAEIDALAAKAVSDLRKAFEDRDYKIINQKYNAAQGYLSEKSKVLSDMRKEVNEEAEKIRQKEVDRQSGIKFEQEVETYNQKQEERIGNAIASGLVDIDGNGEIVSPTAEDILSYAQDSGIDPKILTGLVNARIDEVRKMGTEQKRFLYQQKQDEIQNLRDQEKFNFQREQFDEEKRQFGLNYQLKSDEAKSAAGGLGLSGYQLNDALKKGYVTEAQLKLYAQQVNAGTKPAILKEKSAEQRKLESNMMSGISAVDLLSKKSQESFGTGKAFDSEYAAREGDLIEIISNLKTGAAYTDEQLDHFKGLLPKFWQTEETRQKNLNELKNEFIRVLGPDGYNQLQQEVYADADTFKQFGTIKEQDEFNGFLESMNPNPSDDINDYFDIFKEKKGFSSESQTSSKGTVQKLAVIPDDTKGGQCGRFVNKLTGLGVGDSFASKMAKMDPKIKEPEPGMVFTMPYKKYGHIGFIMSIKDGVATVKDSNWFVNSAPEEIRTHEIPVSKMTGFKKVNLS